MIRVRHDADLASPVDEAALLRALAAELQSGASLRWAIAGVEGAESWQRASRLAQVGAPIPEVAAAAEAALPFTGRSAAAALRMVAVHGASAAAVFTELADQADASVAALDERKAATTQARMSAMVVASLPLVLATALAAGGRLSSLLAHGSAGRAIVGIGFGLQALGVAVVVLLLRSTR